MKVTGRALRNGSTTVPPPVKQRLSFDDVMDDDNKREDAENVSDNVIPTESASGNATLSMDEEIRKMLPRFDSDGKFLVSCLHISTDLHQIESFKKRKTNFRICYGCELFLQEFPIAPPGRKKRMRPLKGMYKCNVNHMNRVDQEQEQQQDEEPTNEMHNPFAR